MNVTEQEAPVFRFGSYTADVRSGELRKYGTRIPLQIQPFQVLSVFLERPNELITREELQRKLWPSDTFVDFDHGLNKAINKLRDALCDTAEHPQFIETVPRRGYRFVAPVVPELPAPTLEHEEAVAPEALDVPATKARPRRLGLWAWTGAATLTLVLTGFLWISRSIPDNDAPVVAVLPLAARGTPGDYDVADGVTDALIEDLSLLPGLGVISHASVFQYRNKPVEPREAGQKLRATSVLTGRVEQAGTTISVVLELTDVKNGRRIWGQQYTRNLSERAALQEEIAESVGAALRPNTASPRSNLVQKQPSGEAEQLYFTARYYFFKETPEDVREARRLFKKAMDQDPTYALAWAGLGDTYDWMATEGFQPLDEVLGEADQAKRTAGQLNGSRAEIHYSMAALEMAQWHWPKAEAEFQRGLTLNPNYAEGHRLYSIYLRTMKRFPESLQHAQRMVEIDPLSMQAKSHLALTYYYARLYQDAARQYRLILKEYPEAPGAHAGLASVQLHMGQEKEAVEEWAQALSLAGDESSAGNLRQAYAIGGLSSARIAVLGAELRALRLASTESYVSPLEFAYRYALLNDKENAFHWLEKAYAERSPQLFNLNVDPDYDNLRDDARFSDLLARLHIPT